MNYLIFYTLVAINISKKEFSKFIKSIFEVNIKKLSSKIYKVKFKNYSIFANFFKKLNFIIKINHILLYIVFR